MLVKTLGQGSFGVVKLGIEMETKQKVAIKILKKLDDRAKTDLEIEIHALKRVKGSPYILELIDHGKGKMTDKNGKTKEVFFFALEYASGGEFFDYVVECAKFNQKLTRYYFHQLLFGLKHCHKNRVYHRDIKMENLILDSNYNLKIIDFGLAAVLKDDESEKMSQKIGTKGYQPPEVLAKQPYLCSEFDVFSSGVILFMMLVQLEPFENAWEADDNYKAIMLG